MLRVCPEVVQSHAVFSVIRSSDNLQDAIRTEIRRFEEHVSACLPFLKIGLSVQDQSCHELH